MRNLLAVLILLMAAPVFAQELPCHQPHKTQELFEKHPHIHADVERIDRELDERSMERYVNRGGGDDEIYIIPVVFHIIHEGGSENISDEQVEDAIRVLNEDFRGLNPDFATVQEEFAEIKADIGIEFRLAKRDPEGNCSRGINRIYSELTNEGQEQMKALIQWPRDMYLNVWVCKDAGGPAGYTYRPGSVDGFWGEDIDGIVLLHNYVGAIGTSNSTRASALTHEVGHWINLRHTWGPGNTPAVEDNCFNDDGVPDTPLCEGTQSCNLQSASCGSLDNVENYMDYSYCYKMFTQGQRSWMRTALTSDIAQRNQLITQQNLINTGVLDDNILCDVDFVTERKVVCLGDEVSFDDLSFHDVNSWTWNFGDGTEISGDDPESFQSPTHTYLEPGTYNVSLTAENAFESITETKEGLITVLDSSELQLPFFESFENDDVDEYWFITDEDGDEAWEVTNSAGYTGDRSMRLRNFNTNQLDTRDAFQTATFDMSGYEAITITYKWAYANRLETTDDRLRIKISTNCGSSWITKTMHRGNNDLPSAPEHNGPFTPNGIGEWAEDEIVIDASSQLVTRFRLQFEMENKGGNNIYIDDINIEGLTATGVEELANEGVRSLNIYPNPATNQLNVAFNTLKPGQVNMQVVDMTGRVVVQPFNRFLPSGSHQEVIDITNLAQGVYLLQVENNGAVQTQRLVKD